MRHRHDTYDWYDDDAFAAPAPVVDPAVAGLPESWWNYEWWMAGIVYAGLWLLESWTSRSPAAVAGHMIWSLAMLLLALACCYGLYRVCARYSQRAGRILCTAIGIAMLLAHSYSGGL